MRSGGGAKRGQVPQNVESVGRATARYSRYFDLHIEAVCFVPEGLLVTNEGRDVFLFRNEDFVEVNR